MIVDAVGAGGRVSRIASRSIRGTSPILHLRIPRDTVALLVIAPADGTPVRVRLRVPAS